MFGDDYKDGYDAGYEGGWDDAQKRIKDLERKIDIAIKGLEEIDGPTPFQRQIARETINKIRG